MRSQGGGAAVTGVKPPPKAGEKEGRGVNIVPSNGPQRPKKKRNRTRAGKRRTLNNFAPPIDYGDDVLREERKPSPKTSNLRRKKKKTSFPQ